MARPANPKLTKENVKAVCGVYKLDSAAQVLGISVSWLKALRKKYGLVSSKIGVDE